MLDSYLGQAGFGEQIQLYSESFWRQVGSAVFWPSIVLVAVLVFVALAVMLVRPIDPAEQRNPMRTGACRPGSAPTHGAAATRRTPRAA
jgi:hypothetical protein